MTVEKNNKHNFQLVINSTNGKDSFLFFFSAMVFHVFSWTENTRYEYKLPDVSLGYQWNQYPISFNW